MKNDIYADRILETLILTVKSTLTAWELHPSPNEKYSTIQPKNLGFDSLMVEKVVHLITECGDELGQAFQKSTISNFRTRF